MKKITGIWIASAVAGVCLIGAGAQPSYAAGVTSGAAAPLTASYMQDHDRDDRGWEQPPEELHEISRQGFHDGIEGARKDYGNHRRPDVHNREEFRHPNVPHRDREAYRRGFERGYQVGVEHLYHERER
jgi:hypothetical protein